MSDAAGRLRKARKQEIEPICNRKSFRNSRAQYPLGTESSSPSGHNQKPVTTNFTGCKPDEIYADFVFIDDGKYLIKCKNNCVPEERVFLKTWVRKEVSWKSVGRAKQLQYMQTKEFSEYS